MNIGFEGHDRAYKKTEYLNAGAVVSAKVGTMYIGDGAWGIKPSTPTDNYYSPNIAKTNFFLVLNILNGTVRFVAKQASGEVVDFGMVTP